jgi:hypothetical protein
VLKLREEREGEAQRELQVHWDVLASGKGPAIKLSVLVACRCRPACLSCVLCQHAMP